MLNFLNQIQKDILNAVPDGILVVDVDTNILFANIYAEKLYGYTKEQLIGQQVEMLVPHWSREVHKAHAAQVREYIRHPTSRAMGSGMEFNGLRQDGTEFPLDVSLSTLMVGDKTYVISAFRDVRELINARQAVEVSRLRLANRSHEIRTPMNGVIGMTELLCKTPLNAEQFSYVDVLQKSGNSLLQIINTILDFSNVEAGKTELVLRSFNFRSIVQNICALMISFAEEKKLQLTSVIADDVPFYICGDGERLQQILIHLINNAIKFTPEGTVSLNLRRIPNRNLMTTTVCTTTIRFEVKDTGIGIPESFKARIFDPFVQNDSTATRRYDGTGLGLSIAKRLVSLMGGIIGVESEERRGSTFWFEIPFIEFSSSSLSSEPSHSSALPSPQPPPSPLPSTQPPLSPLPSSQPPQPSEEPTSGRILVVDDNNLNLIITKKMIEKFGVKVDTVLSGVEACRMVSSMTDAYDLIFMDCQMPDMDGYTTTERLRNERCTAPIVALTAHALEGEREKCLQSGMTDYLTKPVRIADFTRIFDLYLNKQIL